MDAADAALIGLWLVVLVLFCSVAVLYNAVRQLQAQVGARSAGGNDGERLGPSPGRALADLGPAWPAEIDADARHILLFATPTCLSCHQVLSGLKDHLGPDDLTIVVAGPAPVTNESPFPQLVGQDALFDALNVVATPLLVQIADGRVVQVGTAGNKAGARRVVSRMLSPEESR
jgi:hypothetical protein